MAMIVVQVWHVTGNKMTEVELPNDVPVNRILEVLIDRMSLARIDPIGQPQFYKLRHEGSGKLLLDEQSLEEVGAKDGDVLRLLEEFTW